MGHLKSLHLLRHYISVPKLDVFFALSHCCILVQFEMLLTSQFHGVIDVPTSPQMLRYHAISTLDGPRRTNTTLHVAKQPSRGKVAG